MLKIAGSKITGIEVYVTSCSFYIFYLSDQTPKECHRWTIEGVNGRTAAAIAATDYVTHIRELHNRKVVNLSQDMQPDELYRYYTSVLRTPHTELATDKQLLLDGTPEWTHGTWFQFFVMVQTWNPSMIREEN